jgi:hypothetical protein
VLEIATRGEVRRDGGVDGVVEKGNGSEFGEAAEEGRERAGKVGVGEVEGRDGVGASVASDARPFAGRVIALIPGGERGIRVVEGVLEALEVQALLVEREGGGRNREKEEEKEEEHRCCCWVW